MRTALRTAWLKSTARLLVLTLNSLACSGLTDSERAVTGTYSLAQLNGQVLPARYDTTCEFPGTSVPSRPGENRALSGSIVLLDEGRTFTMQLSTEASCGPGHLVRNTPTGGGTWKIDPGKPNTVLFTIPQGSGSFAGLLEAALEGPRLTSQTFLAGASGTPVPVTLLFVR